MISRLRVKNFKCLADTGDLEIRPLTFLVGPNSSGKSSLLHVLTMLRQTVVSPEISNPLVANGPLVEAGAYPDFVFGHDAQRDVEIEIESPEIGQWVGPIFFRATFGYDAETTEILLRESEFRKGDDLVLAVRADPGGEHRGELQFVENGERKTEHFTGVERARFWFRPSDPALGAAIGRLCDAERQVPPEVWFVRHLTAMAYIGPLREPFQRAYITPGQAPLDVGVRGENTADVLWAAQRSKKGMLPRVAEMAPKWLAELSMADTLRLDSLGESNQYRVQLTDPSARLEVNVADVGFGASQTLPIIVQSFYTMPGGAMLLEQPEIHLHPRAQSLLGDLFIEAAEGHDRTFIIETHSEHILARVRLRIAEGQLSRDDVAIYYFEPAANGTQIREVTLNDNGQYVHFPPGFFEEDVLEAFAHLEAMRKNG